MATGFYLLDNPNPNPKYQQWAYPRRFGGKLSGTCIVHTSESVIDHIGPDAGAEDCARFISTRQSYGSYHSLVDSDSIIELAPYEYETWQDTETNNHAVGISCAVKAGEWLTIEPVRRNNIYLNLAWVAADFVIYMRTAYGIEVPRKRITGAQARAGVPGFCAHGDSGLYRSDPGANFDWALFFKYTDMILNGAPEEKGMADFHATEGWYGAMISAQARIDKAMYRSMYVRGDKSTDIYDITGGVPRKLTIEEWEVIAAAGYPYVSVDQKKLDTWIKQYNERNPA